MREDAQENGDARRPTRLFGRTRIRGWRFKASRFLKGCPRGRLAMTKKEDQLFEKLIEEAQRQGSKLRIGLALKLARVLSMGMLGVLGGTAVAIVGIGYAFGNSRGQEQSHLEVVRQRQQIRELETRIRDAEGTVEILNYSPKELVRVPVGSPVELKIEFVNRWFRENTFVAGVTIWDATKTSPTDPDAGIVTEYVKTRALRPGEGVPVTWTHTVDKAGEYVIQFGVWRFVDKRPARREQLQLISQSGR